MADLIAQALAARLPATPPATGWTSPGTLANVSTTSYAISAMTASQDPTTGVIYVPSGNTAQGTNAIAAQAYAILPDFTNATMTNPPQFTAGGGNNSAFAGGKHVTVSGGTNNNIGGITTNCWVYTPAGTNGLAGSWTAGASLPVAFMYHAVCALGGFVYSAGGTNSQGSNLGNFYRYEVATNTWATLQTMPAAVQGGALVGVGTKLYYFPGSGTSSVVYVYDTVALTWTTISNVMPGANTAGVRAAAVGTTIHVVNYNGTTASMSAYDTVTNTATVTGVTVAARGAEASLVVRGTRLTFLGGTVRTIDVLDTNAVQSFAAKVKAVQQYVGAVDPVAYSAARQLPATPPALGWTTTGLGLGSPTYAAACAADGNRIYFAHGYVDSGVTSAGYVWDVVARTVATLPNALSNRYTVASTWCNGRLWSIGGANSAGSSTLATEAYTPAGTNGASGTWASLAGFPGGAPTYSSAATLGTSIYVAGGQSTTSNPPQSVSGQLFRYDTVGNAWTTTLTAMPVTRTQGALVTVGTKLVYVGGLNNTGAAVTGTVVYDTVSGTWSTLESASTIGATSATVVGGTVYGTYGLGSGVYSLNPTTGVFSFSLPNPPSGHRSAGAVTIGSGFFLVSGTTTTAIDRLDVVAGPNYARAVQATRALSTMTA